MRRRESAALQAGDPTVKPPFGALIAQGLAPFRLIQCKRSWDVNNDFQTQINVLVLEDDPVDAILIRRAFQRTGCDPFVCRNTSEATAYLLGSGMYCDRLHYPLPDIFVTDIRLGQDSGIHFLAWLRSINRFKELPVVVLSGAASPEDIRAVQQLKAHRVLIKPSDPTKLNRMLQEVCSQICPRAGREELEVKESYSNHELVAA